MGRREGEEAELALNHFLYISVLVPAFRSEFLQTEVTM